MGNPIILFHTEKFNFEKAKNDEGKDTVIISGDAQPLDDDSRNGVRYRPDSVKKAAHTLKGVAFLFNHDSSRSLGHVVDSGLSKTHLTYTADVDPEEKEYIRKVERKDIKHVSVGCMVENVEFDEEENIYICDVKEYVELSAVTIPGFSNTSANKESAIFLANELGDKNALEKLKAAVKKSEDTEEIPEEKVDKVAEKVMSGKMKVGDNIEDAEAETPEEETPSEESIEANDDEDDEDSDDDEEDEEEKEGDDEDDSEEGSDDDEDEDETDDDDSDDDEEETKDDDEDDSEESDDEDDEDEEESGEAAAEKKMKELQKKADEEAEAEDETTEEKVAKMSTQMKEVFSKCEDLENRVAIAEANIDAMNDGEEDAEAETPDEKKKDLNPDESEEFKDNHKEQTRTKENLSAKEKALLGKETKKVSDENRKIIKTNDVLLKNKSY